MNGKQAKELRKQLRNVVQELLPEILNNELLARLERQLSEKIVNRLNSIDERQKDIQGYMVRQSARGIEIK